MARITWSGSVSIAVPWTTIVTGTRKSTMSQAPRRGGIEENHRGATELDDAGIATQNARNGIGAGIRSM